MEKIQITNISVIESLQNALPEASVDKKGLLTAGKIANKNVGASVLLCTTTSSAVTGSILLSVSATTSGLPSLYFITMGRPQGNIENPTLRVKVLSGSYNIKIIGKTDAAGICKIYAERVIHTPVLDAFLFSKIGITLNMATANNSEFEGGFEAELI